MTPMSAPATTARRRPRRQPLDLSLLTHYRENPAFLDAAIKTGAIVVCPGDCHRVLGVGNNRESAVRDSLNNGTGVRKGGLIFCTEHAGDKS